MTEVRFLLPRKLNMIRILWLFSANESYIHFSVKYIREKISFEM